MLELQQMSPNVNNILIRFRDNQVLRIFLACSIAFLIFIIIVFLAQTHKRISIEDACLRIKDVNLQSCIKKNSTEQQISFSYELKSLICPLKLNYQNQPLYIYDLSGLEQFLYLEELDLSNSQLSSLKPLKPFLALKKLRLSSANIFNIDDLKTLINLQELDLSENSIRNASAISKLTKLKKLNLGNNNISDLEFLSRLSSLGTLNLRSNMISSISSLRSLSQLNELKISKNSIYNINALTSLRHLRRLDLSENQIQILIPLAELTELKTLILENNNIEDVSALTKLTPAQIDLSNNNISKGIGMLYTKSMKKKSPKKITIDLESNDNIPCRDIQVLESKLTSIEILSILEPKVCSERIPSPRKKKFWNFWNLR